MRATSKQDGPPGERAEVNHAPETRSSLRERLLRALGESAWTALGGKVAAYVAGFFALALVGSGDMLRLLPLGRPDTTAGLAMVAEGPAPGAPAGAAAPEEAPAGREEAGTAAPPPHRDAGATAPPPRREALPAAPPPHQNAGAATDAGTEPPGDGDGTSTPAPAGVTLDGKVVLNLATEADLRRLPGIGPAKAKAILELRAKLKRFRKVEDLLRVKGLGRRSLKRLRPLVVVDPP